MFDDLLPLPSLRPDGRLDRLNYGGGDLKQGTQRWVGSMKQFRKETGINPADGKKSYARYSQWAQSGGGSGGSGGGSSSISRPPQQKVASPPPAPEAQSASNQGTSTGTQKKRRTLLSGGNVALSQPYGTETILGAS